MNLLDTVKCTCIGCEQTSHIPKWQNRWTCYSCGRGNKQIERPKGEDAFAEFLEYSTGIK